ncbi:hypothetical protein [Streptomyces sp. CFMR 7]|uniref:hypothetical protein n=1 Tax=Streptomyces sp. CFMR 7 TaxID=1649184 RepID=UPI0011A47AA3|nr:hypothetical protein [Streptomyces sp. CFMR 7]
MLRLPRVVQVERGALQAFEDDQGLGLPDQRVPAVRGGYAARSVPPQELLQALAVLYTERLQALDVPAAFLGAYRAERGGQERPVRPVTCLSRGEGPGAAFGRCQDRNRLRWGLLRGGGDGIGCVVEQQTMSSACSWLSPAPARAWKTVRRAAVASPWWRPIRASSYP